MSSDNKDSVDRLLAAWRIARPDLDAAPLGIVGRVIVLAEHLRRSVDAALKDHGLTLGQFDILATLRRHEATALTVPPPGMTPGTLLKNVVLSSGGMTNRLDRLERDGFIAREDDPTDRRGVVVRLTVRGRKLIDAATETRFQEARQSAPTLTAAEAKTLTKLLRTWLAAYDKDVT